MTRQEVYENLNEVFQYVFDDDSIEVNDETTANDIEDWDSFEHINLVIAVEKRFQVKFTVGEANEMKISFWSGCRRQDRRQQAQPAFGKRGADERIYL